MLLTLWRHACIRLLLAVAAGVPIGFNLDVPPFMEAAMAAGAVEQHSTMAR